MQARWLPKDRAGKLARLLEEIAEVLKELGKVNRFGLDTRYCPARKRVVLVALVDPFVESNREALLRELADLKDAIAHVEEDLKS